VPIYTFKCEGCGGECELISSFLVTESRKKMIDVGDLVISEDDPCADCGSQRFRRTAGQDAHARTAGRWRP
jgi:hypothetical protein